VFNLRASRKTGNFISAERLSASKENTSWSEWTIPNFECCLQNSNTVHLYLFITGLEDVRVTDVDNYNNRNKNKK
jgi:hypothetical protein